MWKPSVHPSWQADELQHLYPRPAVRSEAQRSNLSFYTVRRYGK